MENETKNFHFMELDWLVYFPKYGNRGKYLDYRVVFIDRSKCPVQAAKIVSLRQILEKPEFENNYPHTVGFYKGNTGEGAEFKPDYLEIRKINSVEEFWLFLNSLDI
ncbi:MAG: hypothetical protein QXD70_00685 [Candidatus Bathyarchaeia archaeon]